MTPAAGDKSSAERNPYSLCAFQIVADRFGRRQLSPLVSEEATSPLVLLENLSHEVSPRWGEVREGMRGREPDQGRERGLTEEPEGTFRLCPELAASPAGPRRRTAAGREEQGLVSSFCMSPDLLPSLLPPSGRHCSITTCWHLQGSLRLTSKTAFL